MKPGIPMQIMQIGRHFLEGSRLLGFDDQRLSLAKRPELQGALNQYLNFEKIRSLLAC